MYVYIFSFYFLMKNCYFSFVSASVLTSRQFQNSFYTSTFYNTFFQSYLGGAIAICRDGGSPELPWPGPPPWRVESSPGQGPQTPGPAARDFGDAQRPPNASGLAWMPLRRRPRALEERTARPEPKGGPLRFQRRGAPETGHDPCSGQVKVSNQ